MRTLHQHLRHDSVGLGKDLFNTEVQIGERLQPFRDMTLDCLRIARRSREGRSRFELMGYASGREDFVSNAEISLIPEFLDETLDYLRVLLGGHRPLTRSSFE